ncbi:MAG: queuosine precursor transporter, partial [Lachnospiraceae bacterium]|nr:queuosine precursor transporter [Lachnospiraceae bacterium]
ILLLCKKLFGKTGLMVWVSLATVLANIITAKNVNIFGLSTAIGTVMFASIFLATDILTEFYSAKDAKKAINVGLFSNVILIVSTQIALLYTPSEFDYANDAMKTLFSLNLRISIASAAMYYIANMADILVFSKIKVRTSGKYLWLRNNVATILCNCLENFGFIGLAFAGIYDVGTIMTIAISTSIVEAIVAVCDTPFLYLAKRIKHGDEPEENRG